MEEKYKVIHNFKDLLDNDYIYLTSRKDIYPREGLIPTKARIKELTSTNNKIGKAVIEKIENPINEKNNNEK